MIFSLSCQCMRAISSYKPQGAISLLYNMCNLDISLSVGVGDRFGFCLEKERYALRMCLKTEFKSHETQPRIQSKKVGGLGAHMSLRSPAVCNQLSGILVLCHVPTEDQKSCNAAGTAPRLVSALFCFSASIEQIRIVAASLCWLVWSFVRSWSLDLCRICQMCLKVAVSLDVTLRQRGSATYSYFVVLSVILSWCLGR
jgi:hypothetical protein